MKLNKNIDYWNKFYKKKLNLNKPSSFASFVLKFLKKSKIQLIDIGCGNGRDIFFFKRNKINFIGIDLSKSATKLIQGKLKTKKDKKNIFNNDFVKFDYENNINGKFSIYSRFTLHTINQKNENIFFNKISKNDNLEYLFIETRSDKDELFGVGKKLSKNEFVTDHYRRFINKNILIKKLKKFFKILYLKEAKGFSKYNNQDPCLIRIIAKKKLIKT